MNKPDPASLHRPYIVNDWKTALSSDGLSMTARWQFHSPHLIWLRSLADTSSLFVSDSCKCKLRYITHKPSLTSNAAYTGLVPSNIFIYLCWIARTTLRCWSPWSLQSRRSHSGSSAALWLVLSYNPSRVLETAHTVFMLRQVYYLSILGFGREDVIQKFDWYVSLRWILICRMFLGLIVVIICICRSTGVRSDGSSVN